MVCILYLPRFSEKFDEDIMSHRHLLKWDTGNGYSQYPIENVLLPPQTHIPLLCYAYCKNILVSFKFYNSNPYPIYSEPTTLI
jgi:hypothetical protein